MISAKVIADSKNEFGNRITTMLVTFPRYILAELNTHRMLSKNSASSRAIPFKKMVEAVKTNPFVPVAWQKDHSGMQGTEYLSERDTEVVNSAWLLARNKAVEQAEYIHSKGATKQMVNRLLEPYMWHTVLITATEWENFFYLRCPQYQLHGGDDHKVYRSWKDAIKDYPAAVNATIFDRLMCNKGAADIHMMMLAEAIWDARNESIPKQLKAGEWHIPFGDNLSKKLVVRNDENEDEEVTLALHNIIKIAIAKCAQTSYTIIGEDEKPMNYEKLVALHDRLVTMGHWSPFEHCAKAMSEADMMTEYRNLSTLKEIELKGNPLSMKRKGLSYGWSGNFRGFIQYRKMFENENKIL